MWKKREAYMQLSAGVWTTRRGRKLRCRLYCGEARQQRMLKWRRKMRLEGKTANDVAAMPTNDSMQVVLLDKEVRIAFVWGRGDMG